jgi:hypothetical protein
VNINLHIERLVLDGLPITHSQGPLVQAAVEAELARLIATEGLQAGLLEGGARRSAAANAIELAGDMTPARLGQQIARSVYGGIGQERRHRGGINGAS